MKLGKYGLPLRSAVLAKRQRRLRILVASAVLCAFGFVAAVTYEMWPRRAEVVADLAEVFTSPKTADAVLAAMPAPDRPAYRHSIVPGGVYSRDEVADVIRKDDVVAAHYEHVDLSALHSKRVPAARAVYVSYRIGDRVFWTKNRVRLAAGETVLTDGHTEIRARCGNLVSEHARQPVADPEPPLTVLDETQPETSSSTIAGARGPGDGFYNVPDVPALASGQAFGGIELPPGVSDSSGAPGAPSAPMWVGGTGNGFPSGRSRAGADGSPFAPPLGNSDRPVRGGGDGNVTHDNHPSTGGGHGDPHLPKPIANDTGTTAGVPQDVTGGGDTDTTSGGTPTTVGNEDEDDLSTVPEPATMTLLALGAIGAAARALRSRR